MAQAEEPAEQPLSRTTAAGLALILLAAVLAVLVDATWPRPAVCTYTRPQPGGPPAHAVYCRP